MQIKSNELVRVCLGLNKLKEFASGIQSAVGIWATQKSCRSHNFLYDFCEIVASFHACEGFLECEKLVSEHERFIRMSKIGE